MRRLAGLGVRVLSVTVVSWLLLATLLALPVFAEEDDEDEGSSTTSTTTTSTTSTTTTVPTTTTTTVLTTTTTTLPTATTTTSPPPPTTSTTTAPTSTVVETKTTTPAASPPTTTTTLPTATTTTAPDDDATVGVPPSDDPDPPQTRSLPPSDGESSTGLTGKGGLVISFESARDSDADSIDTGLNGRAHIDPREELSVAFRVVAETLESQILQAMILGVIVAILTLIGVDRVWDRRPTPSHNPIEQPVA